MIIFQIELVDNSKIFINRFKLELITRKNVKNPAQMTRSLYKEIIGDEKLATMVPVKKVKNRILIPETTYDTFFGIILNIN